MKMTSRDYYEVLEISRTADKSTIKKAFLKKARVMHPDVCDDADAEKNFKELNEAYSVLSDDHKRAHYDMFGTVEGAGFGAGYSTGYATGSMQDIFSGMGFGDLFSDLFGGGASGFGHSGADSAYGASSGRGAQYADAPFSARRREQPTRDEDLRIQMSISIADILAGKEETVEIPKKVTCEACAGTGSASQKGPVACPSCAGTGQVRARQQTPFGIVEMQSRCPDCGGMGMYIEDMCPQCRGAGVVTKTQTLKVSISGVDMTEHDDTVGS